MWLLLAFTSAALLGLYDVAKKRALTGNAVLPVLLLNTLFCALLFLPLIINAQLSLGYFEGSIFEIERLGVEAHLRVILKSAIVLSSWIFGYFAIKHLPLTIVGPINATRPVMVLVGAMLLFGERLNAWQWAGVLLALLSLFLLSLSGRKEGIRFESNRWILLLGAAAVMGAVSGLYDKHIMQTMNPLFVQSWYNLYQLAMMSCIVALLWFPRRKTTTPFHWSWAIPCISLLLSMADFAYLFALKEPEAMISIVSMVRRSSVVVSFACGAIILREKNLRSKALDLVFILIGMIFLYIGSK